MTARWISGALLLAAIAAGAFSEPSRERAPLMVGGYQVLAADFHVHVHPWSWATLTPWDSIIEARRQGLDAFAIAGTNNVWTGQLGRWLSQRMGPPSVLASQEVHTPRYHMIAVGIHSTVDWRLTAAQAIDEIHRQGGVAIAAHPMASYWPGWDNEAMQRLDASEVLQPVVYWVPEAYQQMREFYARKPLTAIASSDYHGLYTLGMCRTYVFARENSEQAILEALRAGRTAVYDREGRVYGDPELIRLATGLLPRDEGPPPPTWLARFSGWSGLLGLLGLIVNGFKPRALTSTAR
jgi:predicted metal-dependent phosphoesterase TrpH